MNNQLGLLQRSFQHLTVFQVATLNSSCWDDVVGQQLRAADGGCGRDKCRVSQW
jgi:hypothetical protein